MSWLQVYNVLIYNTAASSYVQPSEMIINGPKYMNYGNSMQRCHIIFPLMYTWRILPQNAGKAGRIIHTAPSAAPLDVTIWPTKFGVSRITDSMSNHPNWLWSSWPHTPSEGVGWSSHFISLLLPSSVRNSGDKYHKNAWREKSINRVCEFEIINRKLARLSTWYLLLRKEVPQMTPSQCLLHSWSSPNTSNTLDNTQRKDPFSHDE
jgi:hypothetical protein